MTQVNFEQKLTEFKAYIKKMLNFGEAAAVLSWDLQTGAPKKSVPHRSEVMATLSSESFKMSTSKEMEEYLEYFSREDINERLDDVMRAVVREYKKQFEMSKKIPADKFREMVILRSQGNAVWQEARAKSDFSLFKPTLEKIVELTKEFIELWGYEGHKYNTLLDRYEEGMTVEKVDKIFQDLRDKTVDIVRKVNQSSVAIDTSVLTQEFPVQKQRSFSEFILGEMGYDFEAGRLDESTHPFATGLNPGDVRITTRFNPKDFRGAIFGTIHEGGHALYEQNISDELNNTPLHHGTSNGIHESQSRMWENMVGRSKAFWKRYYQDLVKEFPQQFEGVDLETFYRSINKVEPSFIRVEADEVTYNLHIMIRYEIEKGLIGGDIKVEDLPKIWNEKMEEYLGIVPPNDSLGVLQDIHWSWGMIGYFPSYSLGNIYAAQINAAIKKSMPDYDQIIQNGELYKIKEWLKENILRHGKMLTPEQIIKNISGEEITSKYLVEYLEKKYGEVYNF
jgi:carboxypeptidase Taq